MANRHLPGFAGLDVAEMSVGSLYGRPPTDSEFNVAVAAAGPEMPQEPFPAWLVDQKSPARAQAASIAPHDIKIVTFAKKSETALPIEGRVELLVEVDLPQIGDYESALEPFALESVPNSPDVRRRQVQAGDLKACVGKTRGDSTCTTRGVKHSLSLPKAQSPPDEGRFFLPGVVWLELVVLRVVRKPFHALHNTSNRLTWPCPH